LKQEEAVRTLDLRKELKQFYAPSAKKVELVDVPEFQFAMIDGAIEPGMEPGNSPAFASAMEALYGISYTLKFTSKLRKVDPIDYPVMALEGLWWVEDGEFSLSRDEYFAFKDNWSWTVMILQPDPVTPEMFEEARAQVAKKRGDNPALAQLRLERFREGLCVQTLHIGPYADEPATVAKMDAFAAEQGYVLCGKHHEIYRGDPRRSAPEKLKTVLRHPVQKA
jgi:hypothetical protein